MQPTRSSWVRYPKENEIKNKYLYTLFHPFIDTYFGTVCELDVVYNFEKAHFILDEVIIAGELQDTSKVVPLVEVRMADAMIPNAEKVTSMTVLPSATTSTVISHFEF